MLQTKQREKHMSLKFLSNYTFLFYILILICLPCCYKQPSKKSHLQKKSSVENNKITFVVENDTSQKLNIVCFYYAKRKSSNRWTWYKTNNIITLTPKTKAPFSIPIITTKEDLNHVHAYLALFNNKIDAQTSIFQLLSDEQKLDLGKIEKLNNKSVLLESTRYGFKGERIEYAITNGRKIKIPELDFIVENQSGKNLYINTFVYQHHGAHPQWDFEKLPTRFVKNGQQTTFDVDTVTKKYDWSNVRGYVGIFNKDERNKAKESTYESLNPNQKINIGRLEKIINKKIVIIPKTYGVLGGFDTRHPDIEFSVKPRYPLPKDL